ncbi:MAG: membrane dipeptidase [Ignavibacteria bacterium]|nr:membrane dipeptidase [Ignavibacteria bacterium]
MIEDRALCTLEKPGGAKSPIGLFIASLVRLRRLALLTLTLLSACQLLEAGGRTMFGTVRDRHRGTPITSAGIQVFDRSGILLTTTTTNAQGQWQVSIPVVGITGQGELPRTFSLEQNYPNPFNPSTKIPITVVKSGNVRITVYNILGQLVDAKEYDLQAGSYAIDWKAKGSAGVLFYSVEMGGERLTKKMVQLDRGNSTGLGNLSVMSSHANYNLSPEFATDSCRIIASSFVYEPDTLTVAFVDSARADFMLESIHDRAFVIDLHNDAMEMISNGGFNYQLADRHTSAAVQTDIPRFRDGGVDAQIFVIWIDPAVYAPTYFSTAVRFLDTLKAQVGRNSKDLGLVTQSDSVAALSQQKKIAGIIMVEGGHSIEDKIENLKFFYNAGARLMTITWNNSTSWAVSAKDAQAGNKGGLNDFGKQVIRTMDSLGMIIDVSHVGPQTVTDILATSRNPIIASHSGASAVRNHYRNLTDSQIGAIAARGGVIGVVFYPPFLVSTGTARLDDVVRHIDYIKNLVGVDYVAIGSDFDGMDGRFPEGLEDVSRFPALTEALLKRGYTKQDVRKILGENFMRVFRTVCK